MKYLLIATTIFFFFHGYAFAQFQSESNPVETRVGNPPSINPGEIPSVRPSDYRQALIDEFNMLMDSGFPEANYQWAWEFLHRASNTNFTDWIKDVGVRVSIDDNGSYQYGHSIWLRSSYTTKDLFTIIFAHELGHVIYHETPGGAQRFRDAHLNALGADEPLTPYSLQLCFYSNPGSYERETENFAELIAYFLNPGVQAQTGCSIGPHPFSNGNNPLQYGVAEDILLS